MKDEPRASAHTLMSCREVRDLLPLLAGCRLHGSARDRALWHLAHCAYCRNELAEHIEVAELVHYQMSRLPGPPSAAWENVRDACAAESQREGLGLKQAGPFAAGLASLLSVGGVPQAFADLCGSVVGFWEVSRTARLRNQMGH